MILKYEVTPIDLQRYYKDILTGMTVYTLYTVVVVALTILFMMSDMFIAVAAVFYNDGSIKVDSVHMLPRFIIVLTISALLWLILNVYSKRALAKTAATPGKNGQFCEHTITLDDQGFTEETEVNRNFHSWEGVDNIRETQHNVIIQVRLGSGYFVPKNSFRDADEKAAFIRTVNDHLERNKPQAKEISRY